MCLSQRFEKDRIDTILPKKPFYAYKFLYLKDGKLESPYFHYEWRSGTLQAEYKPQDKHTGFYFCFVNLGQGVPEPRYGPRTVLRVKVDPRDVVAMGPDEAVNGAYCIIAKSCVVSKTDFDIALGKRKPRSAKEIVKSVKKVVKSSKKVVKETVEKVKKLTKKVAKKKAVKKSVKKSTKKSK